MSLPLDKPIFVPSTFRSTWPEVDAPVPHQCIRTRQDNKDRYQCLPFDSKLTGRTLSQRGSQLVKTYGDLSVCQTGCQPPNPERCYDALKTQVDAQKRLAELSALQARTPLKDVKMRQELQEAISKLNRVQSRCWSGMNCMENVKFTPACDGVTVMKNNCSRVTKQNPNYPSVCGYQICKNDTCSEILTINNTTA